MATEVKRMDGAVALIVRNDDSPEPVAQLTVFIDDSYPSGVLAIDGMLRIFEVDLEVLNEFIQAVKGKTARRCRCITSN